MSQTKTIGEIYSHQVFNRPIVDVIAEFTSNNAKLHPAFSSKRSMTALATVRNCRFCSKIDHQLAAASFMSVNVSPMVCSIKCVNEPQCQGFNYHQYTGICEIVQDSSTVVATNDVVAFSPHLCSVGKSNSKFMVKYYYLIIELKSI